jgi:hypothetical protein
MLVAYRRLLQSARPTQASIFGVVGQFMQFSSQQLEGWREEFGRARAEDELGVSGPLNHAPAAWHMKPVASVNRAASAADC